MIKVEVQSQATRPLPFKDRDGNTLHDQTAWAYFHDRDGNLDAHPRTISIRINHGQPTFPEGIYFLHPASLYVGDYGSMKVSPSPRLLTPVEFQKYLQANFSKPLQAAA